MNVADAIALAKSLASDTKEFIAASLAPFSARIDALEQRMASVTNGEQGPPGERGERGEPGEPGARGEVGPQGPAGEKGEAGAVGPAGPEGAAGRDGRDGTAGEKGLDGKDGRDGIDGKDGADGFGFDDIEVEHDGERGFTFKFVRGDRVKTFGRFEIPALIYRGVFNDKSTYSRGDTATWGGSTWHANTKTRAKPGTGPDWTLMVKKGSDGRQGDRGPQGPQGAQGIRGNDGRHGY